MKTKLGAFLFGAAMLSLFVPKRREKARSEPLAPAPELPRRLYALVQTKPSIVVLALSAKIEELEREILELNETWNHWAIRSERRRFEIQAAPVLLAAHHPVVGRRARVAAATRR